MSDNLLPLRRDCGHTVNPCVEADGVQTITSATTFHDSEDRERQAADQRRLFLTPWVVQNICFETLRNFMKQNTPKDLGYSLTEVYTEGPDTTIALEISHHYKDAVPQRRPGIYVARNAAAFKFRTLDRTVQRNTKESEKTVMAEVEMPVIFNVYATNLGSCEQMSEYVSRVFLLYQSEIQKDFHLQRLQLNTITPPQQIPEAKTHFMISVVLDSVFVMGQVVRGDDLKLKTFTSTIFTDCVGSPFQ